MAALGEEEKRLWKDAPLLAPTPRVQLYTGQTHYLLGRLNEAEKDLQSAFAAAGGDQQLKGEAALWLALVKEKQGKKQEAQELVKQAQTINKAYGSAFEQLKALPGLCYNGCISVIGKDLSSNLRWCLPMDTVKKEALKLISELPEQVSWDDIVYKLYVRKKIATGIKAAEEGRVISQEEVKKRFLGQ